MPLGRGLNAETVYKIRVLGILDLSWADWFDGMQMAYQGGETVLIGTVVDQAALMGLLTKITHLNLTLLSVRLMNYQEEQ